MTTKARDQKLKSKKKQ